MSVAANLRFAYQKGMRALGFGVASSRSQLDSEVPTVTSGTGAPDHTAANGSIYLRTNGGSTTTVYQMVSGSWTGLGDGVALSVGDDDAFTIGADADISIEYDENGTDDLRITNGASDADIILEDDLLVMFGNDKDVWLEYDEDGADTGIFGGTNGWRFPDSVPLYFGTDKDTTFKNDGSTGLQILIADNDADSFEIAQSTNVYLTCDTTNDAERVVASKIFALPSQIIAMGDAQVKLVYGTAGAGEVKVTGNCLFVDAESSGTEDLLLPPEATSTGVFFFITNAGGEDIVVKEDSDTTTICTISTAESAFVQCNGTAWSGGVVKAT